MNMIDQPFWNLEGWKKMEDTHLYIMQKCDQLDRYIHSTHVYATCTTYVLRRIRKESERVVNTKGTLLRSS